MAKSMRLHGICVTHRNDGTWLVTGPAPWKGKGKRWREVHKSFWSAGICAFEMADNNDQGAEINHKMCEVFNRVFGND